MNVNSPLTLYSFFRSSAAYRVRIALALKGLPYDYAAVRISGGKQFEPAFRRVNAQSLVPVLESDGHYLTQSLAIIEFLEETHPHPALLPSNVLDRQRVRSLALSVACEIHPLNNLRVLGYLTGTLGLSEEHKLAWYRHWVTKGFEALEARLAEDPRTGVFCHGDIAGYGDVVLVPQVANARRFGVDLSAFPTIVRIDAACRDLPPFREAAPGNQPDSE
ncbi:MAG: maleylacetoacetate isomerase [Betaproteobacteria bacterium]|jgi:maleylpyruvate isomerase